MPVRKLEFYLAYFLARYTSHFFLRNKLIRFQLEGRDNARMIFKEIFLSNSYDFTRSTKSALLRNSQMVLIDIGANIGLASIYFRRLYPSLKIISIEASPLNFQLLVRNLVGKYQKGITTINAFVGREPSRVNFLHNNKKPGSSRQDERDMAVIAEEHLKAFELESISLPAILEKDRSYVIKLDIEGGEYNVLLDLVSSPKIEFVLEIVAEVTVGSVKKLEELVHVISKYDAKGFQHRILSDYYMAHLDRKQKQGHLTLSLFR
jgi:FkbM family methyltransferase